MPGTTTGAVPGEGAAPGTRATPSAGPWWHNAVVYQVYPRSFADGDGDGIGDLPGLLARLDHIAGLGAGAVWLCPVYPSPGHDNGYDVADYRGVDPVFGTLDDLAAVVDAAHARGLRVILDVVVNHTSDEHPWFHASRDPAAPEREWYVWRPPRPGFRGGEPGAEPTNWGAAFGGSAWTWDGESGEYYLSLFSRWQPDLNWENPALRDRIHAMMRWWLDRGIDGFRMDVINLIDKPPVLVDGPVPDGALHADAASLCVNGPRLRGYLAELREEVVGERRDVLLLGETPGITPEGAAELADPERGPLDMVLQFEHSELDREPPRWRSKPLDLREFKAWATRWQTGVGARTWSALFLSNHDQARLVSRYGDPETWWARSATLWATLLHLHRGTPFVHQGDEIGMTNHPFASLEDFVDIEAHGVHRQAVEAGADPDEVLAGLQALGRDNARTPMQWDASPQAGFTTGTPWLAVNPNHTWLNVAAQDGDSGSVLEYYRALLRLRREEPVVARGSVRVLLPQDPTVYALERADDRTRVLLIANVSGDPVPWPVELREWCGAEQILTNGDVGTDRTNRTDSHRIDTHRTDGLGPWEARVLRRTGAGTDQKVREA